jgi:hypothetical protein
LCGTGWTVRYDPDVVVEHQEPNSWRGLLTRRYRYGTSAAPLSARHPGALAPAVLALRPAAAVALALARRPALALGVAVATPLPAARRLTDAGLPARALPVLGIAVALRTLRGLSTASTALASPALIAGLASGRTRRAGVILLVAAPAAQWLAARPKLDPLRWTVAAVIDDMSYGAGVWHGCLRHRTAEPLRPRFAPLTAST